MRMRSTENFLLPCSLSNDFLTASGRPSVLESFNSAVRRSPLTTTFLILCWLSRIQKSPQSRLGVVVVPLKKNQVIIRARMMSHRILPPDPGAGRRRGLGEGGVLEFGVNLEGMRSPLIVSYRRLHVPCVAPVGRRPHLETYTYIGAMIRIAKAAQSAYAKERTSDARELVDVLAFTDETHGLGRRDVHAAGLSSL